jgi:hypothetical protein
MQLVDTSFNLNLNSIFFKLFLNLMYLLMMFTENFNLGIQCFSLWRRQFERSRVSSGSIVSDYGLDDRGSIPGRGKEFFL